MKWVIPTAALLSIISAGHVYEIPVEAIQMVDYHQLQQQQDAGRQHVQDDGYQGHQVIQTVQHQGLQAHYVPSVQDQSHHQTRVVQGHQVASHPQPVDLQQPGIAYDQSTLAHQPFQATFGHQSGLSQHQASLGQHQASLGQHQASLGHHQVNLGHQQTSLDHHQASLGHQASLDEAKIQDGTQKGGLEKSARVISHQYDSDGHNYQYAYETENGIKAQEVGATSDKGTRAQGAYSYVGDDGQTYSVTYTADETGFHPQGAHLPTPPPIPEAIAKAVEQNLKDEASGIVDDGQYKVQQGGLQQEYQQQSYQQGHQQQQQYVYQQQNAQDYNGPAPGNEHY